MWSRKRRAVVIAAGVAAAVDDATSVRRLDVGTVGNCGRWLPPVNGKCPDGYPLKANNNSRDLSLPGGRFYDRTVAERCYADAEDAIADGYRPAKA